MPHRRLEEGTVRRVCPKQGTAEALRGSTKYHRRKAFHSEEQRSTAETERQAPMTPSLFVSAFSIMLAQDDSARQAGVVLGG